jgi:hypothetical protein
VQIRDVVGTPIQRVARNKRLVIPTRDSFESLSYKIQREQEHAISANAYPVLVYKRKSAGIPCTCNSYIPNVMSKDGVLPHAEIDALLDIRRDNAINKDYNENFDEDELLIDTNTNTDSKDIEEPKMEWDNNSVGDATDYTDSLGLGSERVSCPICYGTGFVGGYDLAQELRISLPVNTFYSEYSKNVYLNKDRPTTANLQKNSIISWKIILPNIDIKLLNYRILNLKELLKYNVLIDESTNLISKFDGNEHIVSIQPKEDTQLSHLEFWSDFSKVKANISNLEDREGIEFLDIPQSLTMTVSLKSGVLRKGDIIYEGTYRGFWKVNSVEVVKDHSHNVYKMGIEVRRVKDFEIASYLPRLSEDLSENYRIHV